MDEITKAQRRGPESRAADDTAASNPPQPQPRGAAAKLPRILGNPPRGRFALEPRLDGPDTWGWLEGQPIPATATRLGYLYSHDQTLEKELQEAGLLGGRTIQDTRNGQTLFKFRLKDDVARDYVQALKNARLPEPVTGFSSDAIYALRQKLKKTKYYVAPVMGGTALIVRSEVKSFDPLLDELRASGLVPRNSVPRNLSLRLLPDEGYAVAFPVTQALLKLIAGTEENGIGSLSAALPSEFGKKLSARRLLSVSDTLALLDDAVADEQLKKRGDGQPSGAGTVSPPPAIIPPVQPELKSMQGDASLLANVLVFTQKRMADGSIAPFLSIDRQRLPRNMDVFELRRRLLPRGNYYRERLPSLESHAGGIRLAQEDAERLKEMLAGHTIGRSEEVIPFEVHETMRRRVTDSRNPDHVNLLAGIVRHGKEVPRHYLFVRYQNRGARQFQPLGNAQGITRITMEDEAPRIERIEIAPALWEDITRQLKPTLLGGGAEYISPEALEGAVRNTFDVRKLESGEKAEKFSRRRRRKEKAELGEEIDQDASPAEERKEAYDRVTETLSALSPASQDDQVSLLIGQKPLLLDDQAFIKAQRKARKVEEDALRVRLKEERLFDTEIRTKVRALHQQLTSAASPAPRLEHPYLVIRHLPQRLDNFEASLQSAGLLHKSVVAGSVNLDPVRLFILKPGEESERLVAQLREVNPLQSELEGQDASKAGILAIEHFRKIDEQLRLRREDPVKTFVNHLQGRNVLQAWVKQPSPDEVRRLRGPLTIHNSYVAGLGLNRFKGHARRLDDHLPSDVRGQMSALPGLSLHVDGLCHTLDFMAQNAEGHLQHAANADKSLASWEAWAEEAKFDPVAMQWFIVNPTPFTRSMLADPTIKTMMRRAPLTFAGAGPQSSDIISIFPNPQLQNLLMRARSGYLPPLDTKKEEISFFSLAETLRARFRPREEEDEKQAPDRRLTLEDRFNAQLEVFHERRAMLAYEKPPEPPPLSQQDEEALRKQRELDMAAGQQLGSMPVLLVTVERRGQFERLQKMVQELSAPGHKEIGVLPKRFFGSGLVKKPLEPSKRVADCLELLRTEKRLQEQISNRTEALDLLLSALGDSEDRQFYIGRFRDFAASHPELGVQASELANEETWGVVLKRLREQRLEREDQQAENQNLIAQKDQDDLWRAHDFIRQDWAYVRPVEADPAGAALYGPEGRRLERYEDIQEEMNGNSKAVVKIYLSDAMARIIESKFRNDQNLLMSFSRFLPLNGGAPIGTASELAENYTKKLSAGRER